MQKVGAICVVVGALGSLSIASASVPRDDAAQAAIDWCSLARGQASAAQPLLNAASAHLRDRPAPLAHLHTEGTLPHEGIRDESLSAELDWPIARRAAIAWRLSGDARYLRQADDYLLAWAGIYRPDFNPIDETNLDALIQGYALTQNALRPQTRAAMQGLLRELAQGYIERQRSTLKSHRSGVNNNWQSHRIKLITLIAAALGDRAMLRTARELFELQVADNIRPDGSVFDFSERDALRYVVYDLQPLVQAALAAKPYDIGGDWLRYETTQGASLAKALDWLKPFAEGRQVHEEFVRSKVAFDAARMRAGEPGFSGPWDAKSSAALFWLAARLDSRYLPVAQKVAPQPPEWIGVCR